MDAEGHTARAGLQPDGRRHRLRFAVLGPVRAWRDGEQTGAGSPQQRALLAALLLRRGQTATAQELVDALWGEEPPQRALAALRTYASRLRKALGAEALISESGGYAIRLGPGTELDADTAAARAAEAEKATAAGDRARARELYDAALACWDGETLASVPGPYAENQRTRLEEWRLSLLEHRLGLDLQLGSHAEAVSELTALTAAHPLRERLRELLMLALYRAGRQAEALAVYADTRRLLAEELGVDPRPELAELQQRILRADEELARPAEETAPAHAAAFVRPAQLPATVPDFTGRAAFVAELSAQLLTAESRIMAVSAVAGIGGVGKTTLAIHVAHTARDRFPDGQLYADLQGAGHRPAEPKAVLGAFLRALGTPDPAIPDGVEERAALYRSLLAGRRVLLLLDNARDAAQIRPLLPGTEGCAALITSRVRMVDLAGAHLVDLDVMSPEEAMTLFTRIVGAERVGVEREAAMDVVAACGFLPLAIRIAAARLAARRTWTVSTLARKLADERRRLDELQAGDLAVKATFELGYSQLEDGQARAFRLLGLADGPDVSVHAAAALLDRDPEQTEDLLESLVDISLLESAAPGRYRFHDLVRLYARACAERDEPAAERTAALSRLLDFYLATAAGVFALARPGDRTVAHLAATEYPGLAFEDRAAALDWLFSEADCLLAGVEQSAKGDGLRRAADLLITAKDLADSGIHSLRYERAATAVRKAAQAAGDARAESRARIMLTHAQSVSGDLEAAERNAERALELTRSTEDPMVRGYALNDRSIIALFRQHYAEGERYCKQALEAFRADGNRPCEASVLCNLSRARLALGQTEDAIRLAEQGVAIYEEMGRTMRLANARYALAMALTGAGRTDEALDQLTQALAIFHDSRQPMWEGATHLRMAEAHLTAHRPAQAATHAEHALTLRVTGGDWRRGNVLMVLGRALDALDQTDRARACWQDALRIFEARKSPEAAEARSLLAPPTAA
ncbi:BTAD domain-containing putative transcriptional regulator [Streptomyces sp. TRM 70361]|uniref:AfsR/SARP family transcriptional regulator n=1 Tax=Streptomyces sp. TRM 70361 TaxID=3116553 RepID=UPI002E7C3577|nr:BTAD domain-containing putative transcriptional regulator [Streptomyces sp. TRM 70361]MEE1938384.1 BTAD domain-containing putative transcriptional regulator [Streptomyces sp. TRM 70361]